MGLGRYFIPGYLDPSVFYAPRTTEGNPSPMPSWVLWPYVKASAARRSLPRLVGTWVLLGPIGRH